MLIEVGTLSLVLAAGAARVSQGEHLLSVPSGAPKPKVTLRPQEPQLLYSQALELAVAEDFATIADIQRVFIERADDNLLVWLTADHPSAEIRERIFQKQFDLIDAFPEVSFDFNIISTSAQDPIEIASGAELIYSR